MSNDMKPSLPQDVEEWIENIDKSGVWWDGRRHVRLVDVRAFLAGKVLVPVAELRPKIIDCLLATSGLSDGVAADAIVSILTASKWE